MNSKKLIMMIGLLCTSLVMTLTAEAAKKKPTPKTPIKVISVVPNSAKATPKSHVKRNQIISAMKATLKRGKATLKTERKNLAAVVKSEQRNRRARLKAKQVKDNALFAMRSNNNSKNRTAYQRALQAYKPVSERHEASIKSASAQQAKVQQIQKFQRQALNSKRVAKNPRQPRRGTPRAINRSPHFVKPLSAYDRVITATGLPSPPNHKPGQQGQNNRYQGQLSPLAQYLNKNHYGSIAGPAAGTQQANVYTRPASPAFNY